MRFMKTVRLFRPDDPRASSGRACPRCGNALSEDGRWCEQCGAVEGVPPPVNSSPTEELPPPGRYSLVAAGLLVLAVLVGMSSDFSDAGAGAMGVAFGRAAFITLFLLLPALILGVIGWVRRERTWWWPLLPAAVILAPGLWAAMRR